jgi:hypothetical protein
MPNYASRPPWKTLITVFRVVSIVASCRNLPKENGLMIMKILSSAAQPASEKVI